MSEPTDADRTKAVQLLRAASADGLIEGPAEPGKQPEMVERLAAALADERERARAQFLAIAERFAAHFGGAYADPDEVYDWLVKQVAP